MLCRAVLCFACSVACLPAAFHPFLLLVVCRDQDPSFITHIMVTSPKCVPHMLSLRLSTSYYVILNDQYIPCVGAWSISHPYETPPLRENRPVVSSPATMVSFGASLTINGGRDMFCAHGYPGCWVDFFKTSCILLQDTHPAWQNGT